MLTASPANGIFSIVGRCLEHIGHIAMRIWGNPTCVAFISVIIALIICRAVVIYLQRR